MQSSEGQRVDSHGKLIAQQRGASPLPGLHMDTLDTPKYSVPYTPTAVPSVSNALSIYGNPHLYAEIDKPARTLSALEYS